MRATACHLDNRRHGVGKPRIDHCIGTQARGMRQFGIVDVHCAHMQTHGLGVLHAQMPQPADAGDHHPLTRPGLCFLQALVGSDTGADERCGDDCRQGGGNVGDVVGVGDDVVGEAAIARVAAELRIGADRLLSGQAELAVPARRVEPGHADPVTLLHGRHASAERGDTANALMARGERQRRLQRPVSVSRMQIGVADAAGLGFDKDLSRTRCGNVEFLEDQGFAELLDLRCLHLVHVFVLVEFTAQLTSMLKVGCRV